jgi:catechol 2,3-dioxygenase-like lactoylglutathione lyase family enzyme
MNGFRNAQVNLFVGHVERSLAFYRDRFGFVESFRTPAEGHPVHVEMKLEGLTLGVVDPRVAKQMHGLNVGAAGPAHSEIVLWCDDVDATYDDLVAAGVPSVGPPHTFLGNSRAAWLADPDGNLVEIVSRGEATGD